MLDRIVAQGDSGMVSFFKQNVLATLEAAAESWSRELISALPLWWRKRYGAGAWLTIGDDTAASEIHKRSVRPIVLALPKEEILIRRIELPLTSRFQLPNLMRFEALRHVPLPLEQVGLDFRIVRRDLSTSRMVVELAVIAVSAIIVTQQHADTLGLRPEAIRLSTEHGPWFARRPLVRSWKERWLNRRLQRVYAKIAVPSFLGLACILAAQNWAARLVVDHDAAVIVARNQAAGIEPLRQQLAALNDKLEFLANARQRDSTTIVAEEVAHLLPDDAWLQELDIEDQNVRLLGTAHHATDLLRIFSASPLFTNVKFEAPLTQAVGSTANQFDLLATRD